MERGVGDVGGDLVHTTHCLGACVESSVRQLKGNNKGICGEASEGVTCSGTAGPSIPQAAYRRGSLEELRKGSAGEVGGRGRVGWAAIWTGYLAALR